MKRILALAIVIALGAGGVQAKTTYCQDPTTHKRISCKAVTAPAAATQPTEPAYKPTPARKPSMFSGMMKPKPATAPMQSPAPASGSSMMATDGAPHCTKGKVCGHSCIAMAKICHKPS